MQICSDAIAKERATDASALSHHEKSQVLSQEDRTLARMKHRARALGLVVAIGLVSLPGSLCASAEDAFKEEVSGGVEEIFIFRTLRTEQHRGATPACAAAPFRTVTEDHYDLWSIELRASDSRVVRTHRKPVGEFRACFSQLAQDKPLSMYAWGTIARIPWAGVGECVMSKSQPPIRTALALNCQLSLSGLPDRYASGLATSSSLAPLLGREKGPTAHVPGYLSTSVVTVRLWKKATP